MTMDFLELNKSALFKETYLIDAAKKVNRER